MAIDTTWFAVQVRVAAETKVAETLTGYGFPTYVPIEKFTRRDIRKRRVTHERPLIRGYVFANMPEGALPILHDIDGANGVVSNNGEPVAVNPWQLFRVWCAEQSGEFDKTSKPNPFSVGQRAKLTAGPFAGHIGRIAKLKPQRRAQLILALFGRPTSATARLDDLEPVDDEGAKPTVKSAA